MKGADHHWRPTAHQHTAAIWLAMLAWGGKLLAQSSLATAQMLAGGAVVVTASLFVGAQLLHSRAVRRWLCWTDALVADSARRDDQLVRYARRWLALTCLIQFSAFVFVPLDEVPWHRAVLMFIGWYPFGMLAGMTLAVATHHAKKRG